MLFHARFGALVKAIGRWLHEGQKCASSRLDRSGCRIGRGLSILLICLLFAPCLVNINRSWASPGKSLSINTDKREYASQEIITISVHNTGNEIVQLRKDPWYIIADSGGNWVQPLQNNVITDIGPGQTLTETWDQKSGIDGQYVHSGSYLVLSDSELVDEPWCEFVIQDVKNPAPSRDGYRYPDLGDPGQPWVEWWYFKLTDPNGRNFFFCYYVVNPWDTGPSPQQNTGTYVLTGMSDLNEDSKVKAWDKYNVASFSATTDCCNLEISDQTNSAKAVSGGQEYGDSIRIRGSLRPTSTTVVGKIEGIQTSSIVTYTWDLTFTQVLGFDTPNFLGSSAFGWLVYMMEAQVSVGGTITMITPETSHVYQITSADAQQWKGYHDHNWGKTFPTINWIWGQCIVDNGFSLVLGGGKIAAGMVDMGRLALKLPHGYADTDYLFFSWHSGDIITFDFGDWIRYNDEGGQWVVPLSYDFEAYSTGAYPQYKVKVYADWEESHIERLPLPRQVGDTVFNDFEPLGVYIGIDIYEKTDALQPWTQIDKNDLLSNLGGAEYGTRQHGGVGGIVIPVDNFALLTPYIGLTLTILVTTVVAVIYARRVWRSRES